MTKSLAYISIYLGFFGWLFGSDKKEKQDQTSSVQENSSMTEESLEETSPVEEAQIEAPELFPNGLPLKNAKIPHLLPFFRVLHHLHLLVLTIGSARSIFFEQWAFPQKAGYRPESKQESRKNAFGKGGSGKTPFC